MQDDTYLKSIGCAIANGLVKHYGYTNMIHEVTVTPKKRK